MISVDIAYFIYHLYLPLVVVVQFYQLATKSFNSFPCNRLYSFCIEIITEAKPPSAFHSKDQNTNSLHCTPY